MLMISLLEYSQTFLQAHTWLIQPLLLVGVAIFFTYTYYLFYQKIYPRSIERGYFVTSAFFKAIRWPLVTAIWVKTLTEITRMHVTSVHDTWLQLAWKLLNIGPILLIAWAVVRFIRFFEEELLLGNLTKKRPDATTVQAIGKLLRMGAVIIVTLFTLPLLGISVSGIWAFGGGSAIVLGFGAKTIFADYFGGLVIYADRHFKMGDWIYSPEKAIEGRVEYIGWRSTQIRMIDQKVCYVPNAVLSSVIVVNASKMKNRCINKIIAVRYATQAVLDAMIQEVRDMLQTHPELDQRRLAIAHFTEFAPVSLKMEVYAFTKTTDRKLYKDAQQDICLKIVQIVQRHGMSLATNWTA